MKSFDSTKLTPRPAATVNLTGGRPCLDFINSVGARRTDGNGRMIIRDEKLNDYFDLVVWAEHARAISSVEARSLDKLARSHRVEAERIFLRAYKLREGLYRIFKAIVDSESPKHSDIEILNEWVLIAQSERTIGFGGGVFKWEWTDHPPSLQKILWLLTESATDLLTKSDLTKLRQCGGDDCGWIFEDTTRNRSRNWCDTRDCGNRDRVRRFRLQLKRNARS